MTQEEMNKERDKNTEYCKYCGKPIVYRNTISYCQNPSCAALKLHIKKDK